MNGPPDSCLAPAPSDGRPEGRLGRLMNLFCRYLLAAVFLAAAVTKITDLAAFENQVLIHSNLPYPIGVAAVVVLPWLELVCGICLALGHAVREAAAVITVLLVLFIAYALAFRTEPDCHCFFVRLPLAETGWWWPSLRNLIFLLCSLRVAWPQAAMPAWVRRGRAGEGVKVPPPTHTSRVPLS